MRMPLDPEFSDEGAGVRIHFHEDGAAEGIDGAHHIMSADEIGIAEAAIVAEAERVIDAHALHIGAMEFVAHDRTMAVVETVIAMVPGRGAGRAGQARQDQGRSGQKEFPIQHDHLLNRQDRSDPVHGA